MALSTHLSFPSCEAHVKSTACEGMLGVNPSVLCLSRKPGTQDHHPILQLGKCKFWEEVGLPELLGPPSLPAPICPAPHSGQSSAQPPRLSQHCQGARNQSKQGSSPLHPNFFFFFFANCPINRKTF